ncbi:hypothetical protein TIFTF001_034165 [Ficus carica]|uniref:Uncharacterized protein n=1 Tax=Ficus carica TaxID=3494 RepID=A0AA88E6V7_FICCA|nr:hypothetical protein TIFTF001_034165 [Ficus carica]
MPPFGMILSALGLYLHGFVLGLTPKDLILVGGGTGDCHGSNHMTALLEFTEKDHDGKASFCNRGCAMA